MTWQGAVVAVTVFACCSYGAAASDQQDARPTGTASKITRPIAVKTPDPEYPEGLRKKKIQGTVILDILVGEDGDVKNVVVKKSADPRLAAEAVKAVKKWRFQPATKDGSPYAMRTDVEMSFRLY